MTVFNFSRNTLKFPQKNFDMVKEGIISLVISGGLIITVASIWGAPYRSAVTNKQVADKQPVLIEKTALADLDGTGTMATYGPPYNKGTQSIQSLFGFAPQTWWGRPYKLNTAKADVLTPLSMLATAAGNSTLKSALKKYQSASSIQRNTWDQNYAKALLSATVASSHVKVGPGTYGPVKTMMNDELTLAQSGLLSGALDRENNNGVYRWNVQNDLLFLQGAALHQAAKKIDMLGEQWGINHDEQAYPGPWWLTPYTFFYQVPPWSRIASGDQAAAYTVGLLFALLLFAPWIPGLNRLPRLLPMHRLIWRDWYKKLERNKTCTNCKLIQVCRSEFRYKGYNGEVVNEQPQCYSAVAVDT